MHRGTQTAEAAASESEIVEDAVEGKESDGDESDAENAEDASSQNTAIPFFLKLVTKAKDSALSSENWYDYKDSYWLDPKGIDEGEEWTALYAANMLVGHHGFFSLTPVWVLSVVGCDPDDRWPK